LAARFDDLLRGDVISLFIGLFLSVLPELPLRPYLDSRGRLAGLTLSLAAWLREESARPQPRPPSSGSQ